MDPVFTVPYSEYRIANIFSEHFKGKDGYSLYVPLSRQEKGVDLLLGYRVKGMTKTLSWQVKSSRTYPHPPPKRKTTQRFKYYTWFNRFEVPSESDYCLLFGLYPPEERITQKSSASWWSAMVLLFSNREMRQFINGVRTKTGKPDMMFGFGFDSISKIILTRGDQHRNNPDYTDYLLEKRIDELKRAIKK